ncbi:hypothetical protein NEF87_000038 [Candidatus Lokiarchaeum ossiferum]|uniref:Uncharacterized protein n=1 Tax=Candidatus Lokiarchaeum ossiferum TaxID=2951803 RepID=A0ABY6HJS3_9ARCH|nr:hypothetical protein NEF87_000038 [Candidatus Lokiarchaeum sp. B-35]
MSKDDFNINIDFDALTAPSKPAKKTKPRKKRSSNKGKKPPSQSRPVATKPPIDPNMTVQINLDGEAIPKSRPKHRKVRSIIDPAYVNEVNYSSKPGKITIEISYSPKEGRDYRQGANYSKFSSEDVAMARRLLERFG